MVIFDKAGHFPFRDDPDRFIDLLLSFVASTAPANISRADVKVALRQGPSSQPLTGDAESQLAVLDVLGSDERSAT